MRSSEKRNRRTGRPGSVSCKSWQTRVHGKRSQSERLGLQLSRTLRGSGTRHGALLPLDGQDLTDCLKPRFLQDRGHGKRLCTCGQIVLPEIAAENADGTELDDVVR